MGNLPMVKMPVDISRKTLASSNSCNNSKCFLHHRLHLDLLLHLHIPRFIHLAQMPLPFPHAVRKAEDTINRALAEGRIRDPAFFTAYIMLTNKETRKLLHDALANGATID